MKITLHFSDIIAMSDLAVSIPHQYQHDLKSTTEFSVTLEIKDAEENKEAESVLSKIYSFLLLGERIKESISLVGLTIK